MDVLNIVYGLGRKRHHNERIVKKRKKIIKESWFFGGYKHEGKLRKHNLSCSCGWCNEKHPGKIKKSQASIKVKEKMRVMNEEINSEDV